MSFIVLRYKILEKNTGHWPGDSWKRPALILDRDIAHYVCGVIQGTTVIHGIQLPYPTIVLSYIAHLVIAAEYKSYQTPGFQIPLDGTLDIDIAHYVIDEDYEAVKKYGIKRHTYFLACAPSWHNCRLSSRHHQYQKTCFWEYLPLSASCLRFSCLYL